VDLLSIGHTNEESKKCFWKIINIIFATIALSVTDSRIDGAQDRRSYIPCRNPYNQPTTKSPNIS
jgi:hypothetical protein